MRFRLRRALAVSSICLLAAGCTSAAATKRGIVRFNEVFSQARNEILLLNIVRAGFDEPQQFSTVSSVNGAMRAGIGVTGGLDNLILGAAKAFTPSATVGLRNPTVTISPLETKEFREGMMKPVTAEFVDQLLAQGWSADVVFHLTVAGVVCNGQPYLNTGSDDDVVEQFEHFAKAATWDLPTEEIQTQTFTLPASEAAKLRREGVGEGWALKVLPPEEKDSAKDIRLGLIKKTTTVTLGLRPNAQQVSLNCLTLPLTGVAQLAADHLILRSPEAMIQYLGALVRRNDQTDYFMVHRATAARSAHELVRTELREGMFFVLPAYGKSAETLALLAEIIGFQTMNAALNKPTVTVSAE